jgi:hypothetical protein
MVNTTATSAVTSAGGMTSSGFGGAGGSAANNNSSVGGGGSAGGGNPNAVNSGMGGSTNGSGGNAANNATTTGGLGDDNPWGDVQGGQQGWASRYWDCCKPSCGWSGNAQNPVHSCGASNNELGVTDETNSCELNGQSGAFTCHRMAPWAYSTQVSFGFAAINGVSCGTCFHIQFTGSASRGAGQGAQLINGKSMIVMASNIGGIEQGQFDLLIPGGGVGLLNGCSGQWGVSNDQLGAQYGGFLTECAQQNPENHEGAKNCVRSRCENIFQSKGFDELYDGCMWFVDWFEIADNPDFRYEEIACPQELTDAAY